MSYASIVIPAVQLEWRKVCAEGNIQAAATLLRGQFVLPSGRSAYSKDVLSLNYSYPDDDGNRPLLYLCGACPPEEGRELTHRFFNRSRTKNSTTDHERAKFLHSLFNAGYDIDLSLYNERRQGAIYYCVESHSVEVLRVILREAAFEDFPEQRRPNLHLMDSERCLPMERALQGRQFECIRLLVAAGATEGMLKFAERHYNRHAYSAPTLVTTTSIKNRVFGNQIKSLLDLKNQIFTDAGDIEIQANVSCLDDHQLIEKWKREVEELQHHSQLSESEAMKLYKDHNYDLQAAMFGVPTFNRPTREKKSELLCPVCYERPPDVVFSINLPCGHDTCDVCWNRMLEVKLRNGLVDEVICPIPDCTVCFPLNRVQDILPPDQGERYMRLFSQRYAEIKKELHWCPRPQCPHHILFPSEIEGIPPANQNVECRCGHTMCVFCRTESHEPATCEQARRWRAVADVNTAEGRSLDYLRNATTSCPGCRSRIIRDGGCNQMTCGRCGQQFCYHCGRKWRGHNAHYTCYDRRGKGNMQTQFWRRVSNLGSMLTRLLSGQQDMLIDPYYVRCLRQTMSLELDERAMTAVACYITRLLKETLPDEELVTRKNQSYASVRVDLDYIQEWKAALVSSVRVLRNSYILAFNLKRHSHQARLLLELQQSLDTLSFTVKSQFSLIPGYREIVSVGYTDASTCSFATFDCTFREQFTYCHALHKRRDQVTKECVLMCEMRDQVLRASRLGQLIHFKRKPVKIAGIKKSN